MGSGHSVAFLMGLAAMAAVLVVVVVALRVTAPSRRPRHARGGPGAGLAAWGGPAGTSAPRAAWGGGPRSVPAGGPGDPLAPAGPVPADRYPAFERGHSDLSFVDVAGLDEAIAELREVEEYLSHPGRFRALGAELPRGILLHGPPGCGKTLLARALAGETGVPFYCVSAASFVEQFVGIGAARVRQLFETARRDAPSIVFLDELDAIGRARDDQAGGGREFDHTLNQLLVELDGFDGSSGVLILAATNRPELIDPALLRPGRFDRRIRVDRPDHEGRRQILALHASTRPFAPEVDWAEVAAHTVGLAPAELANIVNEASLLAARHHRRAILAEDVEEACARQLAGTKSTRVVSEETRWRLAVHESGHALLSMLLRGIRPPARVSIVSRGGAFDRSAWSSAEAGEALTKRDLMARLVVLLGGRAAELNVLGEPSTRAEDDLEHAADLARRMVERWAMTGRFELAAGAGKSGTPYIEGSAGGNEVRRLLAGAETMARTILNDNHQGLVGIAGTLAERETLSGAELARLARRWTGGGQGGPVGPGARPDRAPAALASAGAGTPG